MSAKHTEGKLRANGAYLETPDWMVVARIRGLPDLARADAARLALCWNEHEGLVEALEAILNAETKPMHVGYDDGPGGGNFIYADAILADSDEFRAARALLSRIREAQA